MRDQIHDIQLRFLIVDGAILHNRGIEVVCVCFDSVEIYLALVQVREDDELFRGQFLMIDDNIQELVTLKGIHRRVHLDLLVLFQVQYVIILIEYFVVCQISHGFVLHEVVSDFEDVVVEIHVPINEGIKIRLEHTLELFIYYGRLEYLLVIFI